ncbi:MAG: hypothetical protein ACI4NJ_02630 [Cellvibrio sp.]
MKGPFVVYLTIIVNVPTERPTLDKCLVGKIRGFWFRRPNQWWIGVLTAKKVRGV